MPKNIRKKLFWLDIPEGRWWGVAPILWPIQKIAVSIGGEPYDLPKVRFYPCRAVEQGVASDWEDLFIPQSEFEENVGQPVPSIGTKFWIVCYKRFIGKMHNLKKREVYEGSK